MTATDPHWRVTGYAIDLGPVQIVVAANAGPRILSFRTHGGGEFLASLPDSGIDHPDAGRFRFLGGHRLWRAPEIPAITYQPDDSDVEFVETDNGIEIVGAADDDGVLKLISVSQKGDNTVLSHRLVNRGPLSVRTAPWSITQMAPGGTAILPQRTDHLDEYGLLPNRSLVLWPYTDLGAAEIAFGPGRLEVAGSARPSRMKIGQANRRGWMAYVRERQIFVKWSAVHDDRLEYPDLGASTQIYREERFLELETVGPIEELAVGEESTHTEVWRILEMGDRPLDAVLETLPEEPPGDLL